MEWFSIKQSGHLHLMPLILRRWQVFILNIESVRFKVDTLAANVIVVEFVIFQ